jgi:methyl-accepting chemotaxis protein
MTDPVTLDFLAQEQARTISELADMRADMRADIAVLLAMVQRLDATVGGLTGEVRALHGQVGRFRHRLDQLSSEPEKR